MKKAEENYKNNLNRIEFSNDRKNDLKDKIILNYKKKEKRKNVVFSILIVFSILLVGTSITYADDIKYGINKVITKIYNGKSNDGSKYTNYKIESDAIVELNYDAILRDPKCEKIIDDYAGISNNDECYSLYSYEELEKELGIKLLKNDLFINNSLILNEVSRVDEKISYIKLRMPNPMNIKKESLDSTKIWVEIYMRTKYHRNDIDTIWTANLPSEKGIHEYDLKSLNTKAYGTNLGKYNRNVFIISDNIAYRLRILTGNEAKKDPDKEVQRILDAFHY